MKATIDKDIIIVFGRGDVEIPDNYPRDVGLERLRWDGEKIVDLATLSAIWVEWAGRFILHCKEFPGCTQVVMQYADRFNLYLDSSGIRVKTQAEIDMDAALVAIASAKAELAKAIAKQIGSKDEMFIVVIAFLCALAIFVRTNNETIKTKLDAILPDLQALPLARMMAYAPNAFKDLKTICDTYFAKVEQYPEPNPPVVG